MSTQLKPAPAFSNKGMNIALQNEDSLFGSVSEPYSAFEPYAWNNDTTAGNGCGLDDTGLDWDAFLQTQDGQELSLQLRMASPIPYLTGKADGESAPFWYVRHGLVDRDTSFALQTVLYYAAQNRSDIEDLNFEFAWLQPHAGDYDVTEAFTWLDQVLHTAEAKAATACRTGQRVVLDGKEIEVGAYNIGGNNYFKLRDLAEMFNGTASQFDLSYDESEATARITGGQPYAEAEGTIRIGEDLSSTCVPAAQRVRLNGTVFHAEVYNIGGNLYFRLRDVGAALGFGVDYDAQTRTVVLTSEKA